MRANSELKIHFVNVNHGDCTIIEFPDYGTPAIAHFAVVDFGAKIREDRELPAAYMQSLIELRRDADPNFDFEIDFVCVTHPHDDHYGGLVRFMNAYADSTNSDNNRIRSFWDCGFRTNSVNYNRVLNDITDNNNLTFIRVSSGSEFEFGDVRIMILAPSVDLRNRFDTYGIKKNDASIVLKIKYRNSYIILAADAEYVSWGKTTEEFPRTERIRFHRDALGLAEREETSDQLKCDLLKLSHHGSIRGTSFEYLERVQPNRIVIPAGSQDWYQNKLNNWHGDFPHQLIQETLNQLDNNPLRFVTGDSGNMIFKYSGGWTPRGTAEFRDRPGDATFDAALHANWA